jgi:hypothetical protein
MLIAENQRLNGRTKMTEKYQFKDEEPRGLKSEAERIAGFKQELIKRFHLSEKEAQSLIEEFERYSESRQPRRMPPTGAMQAFDPEGPGFEELPKEPWDWWYGEGLC